MIKILSNKIQIIATKKHLIFFSILFILSLCILDNNFIGIGKLNKITNGIGILDMKLFYNHDIVYSTLEKYGLSGRQLYFRILFIDFFFIISFALLNSILISFLLKKISIPQKWFYLNLLPFIRGFFDIMENIFIMIILLIFPIKISPLVWISYSMTFMKWGTLLVIGIIMIILIIFNLIKNKKRV